MIEQGRKFCLIVCVVMLAAMLLFKSYASFTVVGGMAVGDIGGCTNLPPAGVNELVPFQVWVTNQFNTLQPQLLTNAAVYSSPGTSVSTSSAGVGTALTLTNAGKYLIRAQCGISLNGITLSIARTLNVKVRRTNNTATDLTNSGRDMPVNTIGALLPLSTFLMVAPREVVYTATAGDVVQVFTGLSGGLGGGSITFDTVEIVAQQIQ